MSAFLIVITLFFIIVSALWFTAIGYRLVEYFGLFNRFTGLYCSITFPYLTFLAYLFYRLCVIL